VNIKQDNIGSQLVGRDINNLTGEL
jgi:hypothetical protein